MSMKRERDDTNKRPKQRNPNLIEYGLSIEDQAIERLQESLQIELDFKDPKVIHRLRADMQDGL